MTLQLIDNPVYQVIFKLKKKIQFFYYFCFVFKATNSICRLKSSESGPLMTSDYGVESNNDTKGNLSVKTEMDIDDEAFSGQQPVSGTKKSPTASATSEQQQVSSKKRSADKPSVVPLCTGKFFVVFLCFFLSCYD